MTDLALSLKDLPPRAIGEILDVLRRAYAPGDASVGVIIFNLEGGTMGEITVRDDEANLTAKVTALDAEGHETTFDQAPAWESSDTNVATVTPSEDGYSATLAIGTPGSAMITVTGVETGSGTPVEIVSTGLVNVTAGDATVGSVEFSIGTPE